MLNSGNGCTDYLYEAEMKRGAQLRNTIINDNCMNVMSKMTDKSVDVTLTDIPYETVSRDSNGLRNLDKGKADIMTLDIDVLLPEIERVTRGQIMIFCGKEQFSSIFEYFAGKKGTTRPIIWRKTNPSPMNGQYVYLSGVEMGVWFKPRGRKVFNAHCKNSVFDHSNGTRKIHPTQKNINLFKELILDNSDEGELIFDPFMGSGTTAVAALETHRDYLGVELDEGYYEACKKRLEEIDL